MAQLCSIVGDYASSPSKQIFSKAENQVINKLGRQAEGGECNSCQTPLFFGFFFDGTKNNYELAAPTKSQSNVARLYDTFPGNSVPAMLLGSEWSVDSKKFAHFFRAYSPGVGSPFPEIGNIGDGKFGLASGRGGEARIIWMLAQAINNVHRYFLSTPLLSPEEIRGLIGRIALNRATLDEMRPRTRLEQFRGEKGSKKHSVTRLEFEKILLRLHTNVRLHWPNKKTGMPKKIEPGIVTRIHVSAFGFSRGATQARAFMNWLKAVCALDADVRGDGGGGYTLGGFPVQFDFMGLFDTVASVGLGNTAGNSWPGWVFDGHGSWADNERSLRVPDGVKCVHLVSAHEIRRSFPLDSISVGGTLPEGCKEIVYPGVHSDVGCGYAPQEQGRGLDQDGADMLARIPLIHMYKEAKLAGVPLRLDLAIEKVKNKFKVDQKVITALNGYLAACQIKAGPLTDIMREQGKLHILWHRNRIPGAPVPMDATASFKRASSFDQNDLHSAHLEMIDEIKLFEAWRKSKGANFKPAKQEPGFDDEHEREWEEISTWWDKEKFLPEAIQSFFDEYVHDSRAWFKLGDADNAEALRQELQAKSDYRKKIRQRNELTRGRAKKLWDENQLLMQRIYGRERHQIQPYRDISDGLTSLEHQYLDEFDRTGQIPRMVNSGREPYQLGSGIFRVNIRAGYLRYRKVYAGGDSRLISRVIHEIESSSAMA
jgi:hypothetical protein